VFKDEMEGGTKVKLGGTQPMHEKETERGTGIELGGGRPMCEEETEGGMNVKLRETTTCAKRRSTREESSGFVHREEMNGRKAQKVDEQHNCGNLTLMRRGDERGKGVGGFWVGAAWESNA